VLVDRSLVTVSGTEPPRYRMLESPRALALELLAASGEDAALRKRHADAVLDLYSRSHREFWVGNLTRDELMDRLEQDLDNGRVALAWMLAHDRRAAVAFARSFASALTINRFEELDRLWSGIERYLDDDMPEETRAQAELGAALHYSDRQPAVSQRWAHSAAIRFEALGDVLNRCRALTLIASSRHAGTELAQRAALEEITRIVRPEWPAIHRMYVAKAQCLYALHHDHLPEVEPALRRWMRLAEEAGSELDRVAAQINVADLALSNGNATEAIRQGTALEKRWNGTRAVRRLAMVRLNLASALLANDDIERAREVALAGWPLAKPFDLAIYWSNSLALLAAMEHRPRAAAMVLGYSAAAYEANAERREPSEALSVRRAEVMVRKALGDEAFERWDNEGRRMDHAAMARLALALHDAD